MRRLALLIALCAACDGTVTPTFPPGLEPFVENQAPWPAAQGDDTTPEAVATELGFGDGYEFAHARGWIHAPIGAVWNAIQEPDTTVDRRRTTSWTVERNIDPAFAVSWRTSHVVEDVFTVTFDTEWRQALTAGAMDAPEAVAGRAAKVSGTSFIDLLEDSVVLTRVTDDVTAVELERHLQTASAGKTEAELYVRDFFESMKERAHGRPLPVWK